MTQNKLCQWCGCEVTGAHDENGDHLDAYACKRALMLKVKKLEAEIVKLSTEIWEFRNEFIR